MARLQMRAAGAKGGAFSERPRLFCAHTIGNLERLENMFTFEAHDEVGQIGNFSRFPMEWDKEVAKEWLDIIV